MVQWEEPMPMTPRPLKSREARRFILLPNHLRQDRSFRREACYEVTIPKVSVPNLMNSRLRYRTSAPLPLSGTSSGRSTGETRSYIDGACALLITTYKTLSPRAVKLPDQTDMHQPPFVHRHLFFSALHLLSDQLRCYFCLRQLSLNVL